MNGVCNLECLGFVFVDVPGLLELDSLLSPYVLHALSYLHQLPQH